MVDILNPVEPAFSGCFSSDGYVHDAQCVIYSGPDTQYGGREICFSFNEDTLTVVDVSDKGLSTCITSAKFSDFLTLVISEMFEGFLGITQSHLGKTGIPIPNNLFYVKIILHPKFSTKRAG